MTFKPLDVAVNEKQNHKLQKALEEKKPLNISVFIGKDLEKKTVLFTPSQILRNCSKLPVRNKLVAPARPPQGGARPNL